MNQQQLKRLQTKLQAEKADLEQRMEQNQEYGLELGMNDSIGELSGYDNHPGDLGSEMFERGKDLALQDADQHHLEEINRAISLVGSGKYGHCEVCGEEIPYERLEALPWTTTCKAHHPDPHVSERRPIEERVLGYPEHSFQDNSDNNAYDGEDAWQEVEQYGTSNPPDYFQEGTSYNELTVDAKEQRGYVDLTEGFSITDITGESGGTTEITHNEAYRKKESEER